MFIVFEGIDRSGKSTQISKLDSTKCIIKRYPDRESISGKLLNDYLQSNITLDAHTVHLLYSANRWESKNEIETFLNKGNIVVVDRYSSSGIAYSAAKDGMDFDWCCMTEKGLPIPDKVIYMQITPEEAKKRGDYGKERYENVDFQLKVQMCYEKLKDNTWITLDGSRNSEELHEEIKKIIF
jgi:dTMP kinase